jgi:hypothetical protein
MTQEESTNMATQLLAAYGDRAFEVSMPDEASYDQMRATIKALGREALPDGEFFVVTVPAPRS